MADNKSTMSELIDLVERVAKDPTYKKDQKALMDIVYLISNHVKLIGDIKTAREYLNTQQAAMRNAKKVNQPYPDVTEMMKGNA